MQELRNVVHTPAQVRVRGLSGESGRGSVGGWAPGVKTMITTQVRYRVAQESERTYRGK